MDTSWDSVRKVAEMRVEAKLEELGLTLPEPPPRSHLGFRYRSLRQVWGMNRLDREGDHQ